MRDADGGPNESATPQLVEELSVERDRISLMIADLLRSREVLDEVIGTAAQRLGVDTVPLAGASGPVASESA